MKVSLDLSTLAASTPLLLTPDIVRITKNMSAPYKLQQMTRLSSAVVEDMTSGPLTRAKAKAQGATTDVEGVIEKVLDQKVTRNKTYYKVCLI